MGKTDFTQRNTAIDIFRALTMFIMIFVNDFWKIHDVPRWLEHAKFGEDYMGLADIVFPCFLFVVGMSIPFAIERRYSKGLSGESTIGHILSRTLALLVMGAFITNSEVRLSPDVSYPIGVYWFIMVAAFMMIWNQYPRTNNKSLQRLFLMLKIIGILLLLYLAVTYRSPKGEVFGAYWGILGTIGWTYLVCALIYVFTRDRLKYLVSAWIVFIAICMLNSRMNETMGGESILNFPRPNFYSEMLGNVLHIGNGALTALTMGGVILSIISTKYNRIITKKKVIFAISSVIGFLLAGVIARQFWILSKISATPTLVFYITAIAVGVYSFLYWLTETGRSSCFDIIKPAGIATLTCYLIPYIAYGLADVTGIVLPGWFTHGFMGIINCLCFAFIIIAVTWLLGKIHIKLKI